MYPPSIVSGAFSELIRLIAVYSFIFIRSDGFCFLERIVGPTQLLRLGTTERAVHDERLALAFTRKVLALTDPSRRLLERW